MAMIELVSQDTEDTGTALGTMWWAAHITFRLSSQHGQDAWWQIKTWLKFSGLWWFFLLTTKLDSSTKLSH